MPRVRKTDVLDDLCSLRSLRCNGRAGTASSDINVFAIPIEVPLCVVDAAIEEIERLRAGRG